MLKTRNKNTIDTSQPIFIYSKSKIETTEECVKSVSILFETNFEQVNAGWGFSLMRSKLTAETT